MNALARARKFIVAVAGAVAIIIEAGVLHGSVLHWATVGSAIVTSLLVYWTPNATVAALEQSVPSFLEDLLMALTHPEVKKAVVNAVAEQKSAANVNYTPPAGQTAIPFKLLTVDTPPAPPTV